MNTTEILTQMLHPREGRHLGDLCGWSLRGGAVDRDSAQALAAKHGLTDDLKWPRLTTASAYRGAVHGAFRGASDMRAWRAELVEDGKDYVVHQLIRRAIVNGGSSAFTDRTAAFAAETTVRFNKHHGGVEGAVELEDPGHPVAQRVHAEYLRLSTQYRADDVRVAFQRAFESWDGLRVLDHGGLWLIPAPRADRVRAWAAFLADIGAEPVVIPVLDTAEAIDALRQIAGDGLDVQLHDLTTQIDAFVASDRTRESTLQARLATFDTLRDRAELYERLLGSQMLALRSQIDAAQATLVAHIQRGVVAP